MCILCVADVWMEEFWDCQTVSALLKDISKDKQKRHGDSNDIQI